MSERSHCALPQIQCGDFNAEPNSDEIRFLSGLATIDGRSTYFHEAWTAGRHQDIGWTWDGAGLVTSCGLAFHEQITGRHASERFGLIVEILHPKYR